MSEAARPDGWSYALQGHLVQRGGIAKAPAGVQDLQPHQLALGVLLSGDPLGELLSRHRGLAKDDAQGVGFGIIPYARGDRCGVEAIGSDGSSPRPWPR